MSITQLKNHDGFFIVDSCGKCLGTGYTRYSPDGGICYSCYGTKIKVRSKKSFATRDEAQAYEDKLDQRAKAKDEKVHREWEAGLQERIRKADERAKAEEIAEQARLAEAALWKHIDAEIGSQITYSGTVVGAPRITSRYGYQESVQVLLIVETDNKEIVKTYTAAGWAFDVNEGDAVKVTATVKSFGHWQGKDETVVVRPKVAK